MRIETKFSLNDTVWAIHLGRRKEWVKCAACDGLGKITLKDNKSRSCPDCYGRCGQDKYFDEEWRVECQLTLGKVQAEISNLVAEGTFANIGHYEEGKDVIQISYMAYETGVGSGSIWYEELLFATEEEAQKECDARNKEAPHA
jgi:hypothetical protein